MSSKKPSTPYTGKASSDEIAARMAHRASGAAGVHDDQLARRKQAAGRTNRVGSRKAALRAALRDQ